MNRLEFKTAKKEELIEYIEQLEEKLSKYQNNGAIQFMAALNNQLKKLAIHFEKMNLDFENVDDKLFDRFLKAASLGKDLTSDFEAFLLKYGDQIKELDEKAKGPMVESYFKQKNGR